jgi:hypothetical protein
MLAVVAQVAGGQGLVGQQSDHGATAALQPPAGVLGAMPFDLTQAHQKQQSIEV